MIAASLGTAGAVISQTEDTGIEGTEATGAGSAIVGGIAGTEGALSQGLPSPRQEVQEQNSSRELCNDDTELEDSGTEEAGTGHGTGCGTVGTAARVSGTGGPEAAGIYAGASATGGASGTGNSGTCTRGDSGPSTWGTS